MSRNDSTVRMRHMLHFARRAIAITAGKARSDLDTNEVLVLAVCRLVELIGEAATHIPRDDMVGMRNRLIHGYDFVDTDIVWDPVTRSLPSLIAQLEGILPPKDD